MSSNGKKRAVVNTCKVETKDFTWEIDNFRDLLANPQWNGKELSFEAGDTIELPSSWKLTLRRSRADSNEDIDVETQALSLYMECVESPAEVGNLYAAFQLQTKGVQKDCESFTPHTSFGWDEALTFSRDFSEDLLQDGGLLIGIKFALWLIREDEDQSKYKRVKLDHNSRDAVVEDLTKLLVSGENSDMTIITKDGRSVKAHSSILASRSPVLFTKFHNEMTESKTQVAHADDLGFEVMTAILDFIYTGAMCLCEEWVEFVGEIVHAAKTYGLSLLLEICDNNLSSACKPQNAWTLMKLVHLHGLPTAAAEVDKYIEKHIQEILQAEKSVLDRNH